MYQKYLNKFMCKEGNTYFGKPDLDLIDLHLNVFD